MTVRAVLLDFDFTLADPRPWLIPAWREALAAIGEELADPSVLESVVGRTLRAQYEAILGDAPSGARFDRFARTYREYRDGHAAATTVLFPGVAGALEELNRAGAMLGVVSTAAVSRLEAILVRTGVRGLFALVEGGAADKALAIPTALSALGVEANFAVYVGDHPDDCMAAARAGVSFVGVETGVHRATDFPTGAVLLPSVAVLPAYLASWPRVPANPA